MRPISKLATASPLGNNSRASGSVVLLSACWQNKLRDRALIHYKVFLPQFKIWLCNVSHFWNACFVVCQNTVSWHSCLIGCPRDLVAQKDWFVGINDCLRYFVFFSWLFTLWPNFINFVRSFCFLILLSAIQKWFDFLKTDLLRFILLLHFWSITLTALALWVWSLLIWFLRYLLFYWDCYWVIQRHLVQLSTVFCRGFHWIFIQKAAVWIFKIVLQLFSIQNWLFLYR